jgi:hypothetical protein
MKSHRNVTKYLILSFETKNSTRSFHIKFSECLSKITKFLCDSNFCLITMQNLHDFLCTTSLIKFMFFDIFINRRTFCFFKCFNRACQIFRIILLIENFDLMSFWTTNWATNFWTMSWAFWLMKLSTINVMTKL